ELAGAGCVLHAEAYVGRGKLPSVHGRDVREVHARAQVEGEGLRVGGDLPTLGELRLEHQVGVADVWADLEAEQAVGSEADARVVGRGLAAEAEVPLPGIGCHAHVEPSAG